MAEYTKKILLELTRLRKTAFKAAQEAELQELSKEFDRWKAKRIGADRLEMAIEKHKGFKKEMLEKMYPEDGDPGLPVADALMRGLLKKEDLSADAYKSIEILIDLANI